MKSIKLLTIITILFLNNYGKIYSEEINKQDTLIKPVVINTIGWNPLGMDEQNFIKGLSNYGFSFYTKLSTNSLEGKTLGQIIKTLEFKEMIGCEFETRTKEFIGEKRTEIFSIYLKNTDTTTICIWGSLDREHFLSPNSTIAYKELMEQTKFRITFYEINIFKWMSFAKKFKFKEPPNCNEEFLEYKIFKKNFPSIFKED